MDLPTIFQLFSATPGDLAPLPGQSAPLLQEISAVHVSDLADPTPFLSGNELLLITGLSLPRTFEGVTEYVDRLMGAKIAGLVVGLGPTLSEVPLILEQVAESVRLPLLVVPPAAKFLDVTKAYWKLRSATEQRELNEAVTAHGDLVRAAFADAPVPATLRSLAQSLHGWAAMASPSGEIQDVYPSGRIQDAVGAAARLSERSTSGTIGSLASPSHDDTTVSYPVTLGNRTVAYLLIGTDNRLSVTKHRVGLAAASLMAFGRVRSQEAQSREQGRTQGIATLVDLRLIEAATRLASRFDIAVEDEVRIVVVDSTLPAAVDQVMYNWCPDTLLGATAQRPSWFLAPGEQPDAMALCTIMLEVDPAASLVVSDAVALDRVHDVRLNLNRLLNGMPAGSIHILEKQVLQTNGLDEALVRLQQYSRADLVSTLVAYLRCRGQWEDTARELHLHRNTVRHRIGRARDLMEVDLDDPDVASELWLLLRRNGLA